MAYGGGFPLWKINMIQWLKDSVFVDNNYAIS